MDCLDLNIDFSFTSHSSGGKVKVNDGSLVFDIVAVKNKTLKLLADNSGKCPGVRRQISEQKRGK